MAITNVNELRHEMFSTKIPLMEHLPLKEALFQHSKCSHYQASIWAKCLHAIQNFPLPGTHGWKFNQEDDCWIPYWSNLMEARTS